MSFPGLSLRLTSAFVFFKGGLDNYLLNTGPEKLQSETGEAALQRILTVMEMNQEEKAQFLADEVTAARLKPKEFGNKKLRKGGRKAKTAHLVGVEMAKERYKRNVQAAAVADSVKEEALS
jgi:hypothetical protein